MARYRRVILAVMLALSFGSASAEYCEDYLAINTLNASHHYVDMNDKPEQGYNETHKGLLVTCDNITAGYFENSDFNDSFLFGYTFYRSENYRAPYSIGIWGGTGYDDTEVKISPVISVPVRLLSSPVFIRSDFALGVIAFGLTWEIDGE